MTNEDETLPGFEIYGGAGVVSPLRTAVMATIEALRIEGLLEPRHSAMCQLALELADATAFAAAARVPRASAIAMAGRELRETLMALPQPVAGDQLEKFNEFLAAIANGEA